MLYKYNTRLIIQSINLRTLSASFIIKRSYNSSIDFGDSSSSSSSSSSSNSSSSCLSDWQNHLDSTIVSDPRTVSILYYRVCINGNY